MCCTQLAGNTGRKNDAKNRHHHTTLLGCIFATKAYIDSRKKLVKQQYLHMSSLYGELWPTNGRDRFGSLGHPCKFQRVSCLGSITARQSSSGHQPNFPALDRGRHLYLAGRPSRWALARILVAIDLFHHPPLNAGIQSTCQQIADATHPHHGLIVGVHAAAASHPDTVVHWIQVRTVGWPHVSSNKWAVS